MILEPRINPVLRHAARWLPGFRCTDPPRAAEWADLSHTCERLPAGQQLHLHPDLRVRGAMGEEHPHRRVVVRVVEPELITDPELLPAPSLVRLIARLLAGVTQYLRTRSVPPT